MKWRSRRKLKVDYEELSIKVLEAHALLGELNESVRKARETLKALNKAAERAKVAGRTKI